MSNLFSKDPGARNSLPIKQGLFDAKAYLSRQAKLLLEIDSAAIASFATAMDAVVLRGNCVFFCGNGGSFAIAEHMVCDYSKGMKRTRPGGFLSQCLGSNAALHTALVNDFGRDESLSAELEIYAKKGDCLVAISSSGNSQNILNAVASAKKIGLVTLGLDGFGGGALSQQCDLAYTTNAQSYPEVEAVHQVFLDCVAFSLWNH